MASDEHENEESEHHIESESLVVLIFFLCILVSIISREINRRIKFPYTPLLIAFGILFGSTNFWGYITEGHSIVVEINPHGILLILLPILIFESSYNAHLSVLRFNFIQVFLLAGPGVVITALLLAVALKPILGYTDADLSWSEALILGFILGTTDPVAVVALLKELGAPLHINTLIENESLFNDGIAMVFFTIFLSLAKGEEQTIGSGIGMFFQLSVGGPLLGLAFALGAYLIMMFFVKGTTFFMSLILLTIYSVFFVAEKMDVGVSGLLALVIIGFFFNVFLKNQMTLHQEHSVHNILGYIQHIDETFLFFLAGLIIGDRLVGDFKDGILGSDWWRMALLYLLLIVIRFIVVGLFFPVLRCTGEGFNWKEYVLTCWSGLRGALSLALALVVATDGQVRERARSLILFHTCCLATLTLILNGTTASFLVKSTQLIRNAQEREHFKKIFLKLVRQRGEQVIAELKYNESYSLTFWDGVLKLVDFKGVEMYREKIENIKMNKQKSLKDLSNEYNLPEKEIQQIKLSRHRYKTIRKIIQDVEEKAHHEYLSKSLYHLINESSEISCEECYKPIDIISRIKPGLYSLSLLEYLKRLSEQPIIGKGFEVLLLIFLEYNFQIAQTMTTVLSHSTREERHYAEEHLQVDKEFFKIVFNEIDNNLRQTLDYMLKLKNQFPNEIQKLSQRQAALRVLTSQANYIEEYSGSFITDTEGMELKEFFFKRIDDTRSTRILFDLNAGPEYILESTFRGFLTDKELIQVCQNYELRKSEEDEIIISFKQPEYYCYMIIEGIIEEQIMPTDMQEIQIIQYSVGNLIGLPNLIDNQIESVIQLQAKSKCEYLAIPIDLLRQFFNTNKKFEQLSYKESLATFLVMYESSKHKFDKMVHVQLLNWARTAKLYKVTGQQMRLFEELILPKYGAYIFSGSFSSIDGKQKFSKQMKQNKVINNRWTFIKPIRMQIKPLEKSVILVFTQTLKSEHQYKEFSMVEANSQSGDQQSGMDQSVLIDHGANKH